MTPQSNMPTVQPRQFAIRLFPGREMIPYRLAKRAPGGNPSFKAGGCQWPTTAIGSTMAGINRLIHSILKATQHFTNFQDMKLQMLTFAPPDRTPFDHNRACRQRDGLHVASERSGAYPEVGWITPYRSASRLEPVAMDGIVIGSPPAAPWKRLPGSCPDGASLTRKDSCDGEPSIGILFAKTHVTSMTACGSWGRICSQHHRCRPAQMSGDNERKRLGSGYQVLELVRGISFEMYLM